MGEWAHTVYAATDDDASIGPALAALLGAEPYAIEGTRTQIGWCRRGAPGWTIVETFPKELLLDRPLGSREPRIATLARTLGVDLLYLAIHDGAEVLFVESNARGRWAATGAGDLSQNDPDKRDRDDPRAGRDGGVPRFVLTDATPAMLEAIAHSRTGAIRAMAKLLGGAKSPHPFDAGWDANGTPLYYARSRGGGGRVRHARFGEGTIVDVLPGEPQKLSVQFDDGRTTVLVARFVERID